MKLFCETIVPKFLPAIRALVANTLITEHGLTQTEAAKRLGITQPAISQYLKGLRGRQVKVLMKNKRIMKKIEELSNEILVKGESVPEERFCEICELIREEKLI